MLGGRLLLFQYVFPWAEPLLPFNDVTVDEAAGRLMGARILVVDNYDSFVFNLVQYLYQLGAECEVVRNDEVPNCAHAEDGFDGVLLSPGPGTPEAGRCLRRHGAALRGQRRAGLRRLPGDAVDGGGLRRRGRPGARAAARQDLAGDRTRATGVFAGLPSPFTATRYHSLARRARHRTGRAGGHGPYGERTS